MNRLDADELSMLDQAGLLFRRIDPAVADMLAAQRTRLDEIIGVANALPSMLSEFTTGDDTQRAQALVEALCRADAELGALNMPMRAVMSEAFMIARTQLFRVLRLSLQQYASRVPPALLEKATLSVAQSIYAILLAEVLWDVVRSPEIRDVVRRRAVVELVVVWEGIDPLKVQDFFPVLQAAWQARNRVHVLYGSLLGVTELFQLLREQCPPTFIHFFTREDVSAHERAAFQEFLFGLSHEDLVHLQEAMIQRGMKVIDPEFARATLGWSTPTTFDEGAPETSYFSFRRRQRAASARRLIHAPGPFHTAEAYVLMYLLEHPQAGQQPLDGCGEAAQGQGTSG
jgi:hypothetical protein